MAMNKKRNTFIVFEILLREHSDAFLRGDTKKYDTVSAIFEQFFNKNNELGKEIQLYYEVLSYKDNFKNKTNELNDKFFGMIKEEYKKLDKTKIFNEQSRLMSELDHAFGRDIYSSFVPEYKILMNLYSFIDDSMSITEKLNISSKFNSFFGEKLLEKTQMEPVDNIVFYKLTEKFNAKYKELLPEQKTLISKYVSAFGENTADFIIYLNEEVSRISSFLLNNKKNELFKENGLFGEKIDKIIEKLSLFKDTKNITEQMMESLLKTQLLIKEIKENEN